MHNEKMYGVSFIGVVTATQLKEIHSILSNNGIFESHEINENLFKYEAFHVIRDGHNSIKTLGRSKLTTLLQKIDNAVHSPYSGVDFNTGLFLNNYISKI